MSIGVSPFLTAGEVFKSPSRTARLIEAYWCYCEVTYSDKLWFVNLLVSVHNLQTNRKLLLRPAIHGGVLAPTQAQRLNYRHWLMVYGKDKVQCTPREGKLIDEYKVRYLGFASDIQLNHDSGNT